MDTILTIDLIATNPNVRSGRPVVAGTGVCVSDIAAAMIFQGQGPDDLALGFKLSLAQVHAALAYYYDHKTAIDDEIRENQRRFDELKEKGVGKRHSILPR